MPMPMTGRHSSRHAGTEARRARQTTPHKHCPHDRRPHIPWPMNPSYTHTRPPPAVFLSADVLGEWTTVSQHDWQHNNNKHRAVILPDSISPPYRRVRPKADVSSIFGCICATRQHIVHTSCRDDDWYYTPRMHAAYARDEI
jgi:hypothetical protein